MESEVGFLLGGDDEYQATNKQGSLVGTGCHVGWGGVAWCGVVWGFLSHGSHGAHLNVCKRCRDACADAGHQAGPITRVAHDGGVHPTCPESGRANPQVLTPHGHAAQ